jgi:hypothetical protein
LVAAFPEFAQYNGTRLVNMAPKRTLQQFIESASLEDVVAQLEQDELRQMNCKELSHGRVCR